MSRNREKRETEREKEGGGGEEKQTRQLPGRHLRPGNPSSSPPKACIVHTRGLAGRGGEKERVRGGWAREGEERSGVERERSERAREREVQAVSPRSPDATTT